MHLDVLICHLFLLTYLLCKIFNFDLLEFDVHFMRLSKICKLFLLSDEFALKRLEFSLYGGSLVPLCTQNLDIALCLLFVL